VLCSSNSAKQRAGVQVAPIINKMQVSRCNHISLATRWAKSPFAAEKRMHAAKTKLTVRKFAILQGVSG
jgi:hypothetical protein